MTTYFVDGTSGNDANSGASSASPAKSIAHVLGNGLIAAGDTISVASTGSFTAGAAITWTLPASNFRVAIVSSDKTAWPSIVYAAGATESIGAAGAAFTIPATANAAMYVRGMTLNNGTIASAANTFTLASSASVNALFQFDDCTFGFNADSTGANLNLGPVSSGNVQGLIFRFKNVTMTGPANRAGTLISMATVDAEFTNLTISLAGATKPAALFGVAATTGCAPSVVIKDSDLSGYNATGGAYVSVVNINQGSFLLKNLKLSATPTIASGAWIAGSAGRILVRNCDSGNTTYTFAYLNTLGTLTQSTSVYNNADIKFGGSTNISWQIVTTSNASQFNPFVTPPIEQWIATLSAQTAKIEIAQASGASNLTDQDIWPDVEYAASASFPNYTYATGRNPNPITGAGTNWTASGATWTGLSTPVIQTLNPAGNGNTFTAAAAGLIQSRIYVGKASTTVYIDPQITGVA